jgi:predicted GH43/DUF377 family glycosyl hydrolase
VLGAFNPGLNRLPNGNLILMVRIAEALKNPIKDGKVHQIRWSESGYQLDGFPLEEMDTSDPRKSVFKKIKHTEVCSLTSLSWILPVELSPQGDEIVAIHYDKVIAPSRAFQEYGIEDARISLIEGKYYMTVCSVSAQRHSTVLYTSINGLNYDMEGIILDHQNKDMLLFEGIINNKFYALTRPLGELYFGYPESSPYLSGPTINLASSPDALHWKPSDYPFIRLMKGTSSSEKTGGGAQPILTPKGWLVLYHGVEKAENIGIYRTFWALLEKENPNKIIKLETAIPVLEAKKELTASIKDQIYLEDVVFTTGIVEHGENYIVASGELDLCCRMTHIPKSYFDF